MRSLIVFSFLFLYLDLWAYSIDDLSSFVCNKKLLLCNNEFDKLYAKREDCFADTKFSILNIGRDKHVNLDNEEIISSCFKCVNLRVKNCSDLKEALKICSICNNIFND